MKTELCSYEYVSAMVSMPSSSEDQNQMLKMEIMEQNISLDQCYILREGQCVAARMVVDEKNGYLGYFTVEDIDQKEIDLFMEDVLEKLDHNRLWRCDLYSDKIHYHRIWTTLHRFFPIEVKRESFTITTSPKETVHSFVSAAQLDQKELLQLMMRASESTLDTLMQVEQKQKGREKAIMEILKDLLEEKESEQLFQVLLVENVPVGFVGVNRLMNDIGGIEYIGVDPRYQGKRYGFHLLEKAIAAADQCGISQLIGDIDEKNLPMRQHLLQCGFSMDSKESVFLYSSKI